MNPDAPDEELPPALPARLLVVDDHKVFAEALSLALGETPYIEVVGVAHNVTSALTMAQALLPDIVLMDVRLGDGDGVAATAQLTTQFPSMRVVVLTGFVDRGLTARVAGSGASALLPKDGELGEMLQALRASRRGRFLVHPSLLRAMAQHEAPARDVAPLVDGEPELLQLLVAGLDATGIARELGVTALTAREAVHHLLVKLGAATPLDAVVVAMRNGLIHDAALG